MNPLWTYTVTISLNSKVRGVIPPWTDPGAPAVIAAVEAGLQAAGILTFPYDGGPFEGTVVQD
jgi:hypothetical protein